MKDGPINSERYLSWADAFFIVYSIDSMESFKGCQPYLQTLALHNKTFRPQTPIILLGNKLDLDRYRLVSVCLCVCMEINTMTTAGYSCRFNSSKGGADFSSILRIRAGLLDSHNCILLKENLWSSSVSGGVHCCSCAVSCMLVILASLDLTLETKSSILGKLLPFNCIPTCQQTLGSCL